MREHTKRRRKKKTKTKTRWQIAERERGCKVGGMKADDAIREQTWTDSIESGLFLFSPVALREPGLLIKVCMCSPLWAARSYADVSKNWQLKTGIVLFKGAPAMHTHSSLGGLWLCQNESPCPPWQRMYWTLPRFTLMGGARERFNPKFK